MTSRALITGGLGFAWRFLRPAWERAWGAIAIASLMFAAIAALTFQPRLTAWRFQILIVAVAAALVAEGGLLRLALGRGRLGPAGLQWGMTEWRLLTVWGLTAVFLFVLGLLAFVTLLACAFAVASSGQGFIVAAPATWARAVDGRGRAVVAVIAGLVLAGLIWAAARVSLGAAASVDRGRVQLLASWPDTRGVVAPLVAARLFAGLAPIGFAAVVLSMASRAQGRPDLLAWCASLAAGTAIAGLWLPLSVGLMAYFYQRASTP
jgi:hypothetical protein